MQKKQGENIQQYVIFPVWSSGSTNPQNTDGDATFEEKEHKFEGRKPASEVYVSPSSSAQTKSMMTRPRERLKARVLTNTFSATGPSNVAVSPTHGKSSFMDTSQLPNDLDMPELEDITYSNDEEDVGAEADFTNLETSIIVSPIPITKVHKDHHVTQIIGYIKLSKIQVRLKLCRRSVIGTLGIIEAMQEELLQFKMQKVWVLVDLPKGKRAIGADYPDKVYKVVKALYGLHQAPKACKDLCKDFEKLMKDKFQMSLMGELKFFLGLQVKKKPNGIFISHDKYVAEILRKFGLTDGKSASTPIDTEKPLLKDPDGEDVDVHTYRSMISSLIYMTSSRPDIMFAVCVCAHFQVTPKVSHLHAIKRIFRYLKGKPHLGLWYPKDSPFNLVAYSDSDYDGASLDRKSTTRGCQFLGCSAMDSESTAGLWVNKSSMKSLERNLHVTHILSAGSLTTPQMVLNSPCLTHIKNWLVHIKWYLDKRQLDAKDVAVEKIANVEESADIQGGKQKPTEPQEVVEVVTTAKLIIEVVTAASETITAADTPIPAATITATASTLTTVPSAARRRNGVVIRDPEETSTPSTIIHTEPKSKDKGKGIMVHLPKPLKKKTQIEQDEAYDRELEAELNKNIDWDAVIDQVKRKEKEDNVVMRYQALKRKPQTEAQARKNMMVYLRNMAGFKIDYFKGMSYDDIRPIFEKYFNSNVAFLEKTKEQMEEEDRRAL
nr:hypothetical protein [Tanacetum cinerariifolium]